VGSCLVPKVDQPVGVARHRGAAGLVGRPGATEGGGVDRRRSGYKLLPPAHPAHQGSGPPTEPSSTGGNPTPHGS
jgi:hypothetical protein